MAWKDPAYQKQYMAEWRARNKEKMRLYMREWCANNRDKLHANGRKSYLKHKDKILAKHREWRKKNPQKMRNLILRWFKNNPEKWNQIQRNHRSRNLDRCRERDRNWMRGKRASDAGFKLLGLHRTRMYALMFGTVKKSASTVELIGCDSDTLRKHIESQWQEGMSWDNFGKANVNRKTWNVDHIIPCSAFDLTDPEQQRKCFHYSNLQPLWAMENISKGGIKRVLSRIKINSPENTQLFLTGADFAIR